MGQSFTMDLREKPGYREIPAFCADPPVSEVSFMVINYDELPQIVSEYLNHMRVVKNRSPKTVYEYMIDVRMFTRFLKAGKKMDLSEEALSQTDIRSVTADFYDRITLTDTYIFLTYCADVRKDKESARCRIVSAIRSFYKYLYLNNKLSHENYMEHLEAPKRKQSLPKYLTLDESRTLLSAIDGKNRARDYCIITLFLNCGLRLSELIGLDISDIREDSMTVTGKGNKERVIYLNDACKAALSDYLRQRPVEGVKDRDALFISNRGTRISNRTVQYVVENFLNKIGLGGQGYSTHKLRHTAATLMYQYGGADIRVLKDVLGHENLNTTEIYTHVANEQVRQATRSNPLASERKKQDRRSDSRKKADEDPNDPE